jgi:predicted PurR-regulated permease PerM
LDFFFVLMILVGALSVLGTVVWFVFFVWLAKEAMSSTQRGLNTLLPNLEQLIQTYSKLPPSQQMQQMANIQNMMMHASTYMSQMNDLQRQKYDVQMGELQGMAASAGIDWTPPS